MEPNNQYRKLNHQSILRQINGTSAAVQV